MLETHGSSGIQSFILIEAIGILIKGINYLKHIFQYLKYCLTTFFKRNFMKDTQIDFSSKNFARYFSFFKFTNKEWRYQWRTQTGKGFGL